MLLLERLGLVLEAVGWLTKGHRPNTHGWTPLVSKWLDLVQTELAGWGPWGGFRKVRQRPRGVARNNLETAAEWQRTARIRCHGPWFWLSTALSLYWGTGGRQTRHSMVESPPVLRFFSPLRRGGSE